MKSQSTTIFGPGGILAGVFLFVTCFLLWGSVAATARVTDVRLVNRSLRVTYEFTTAKGQTIVGSQTRTSGSVPQVGETLTVYYLPTFPNLTIVGPAGVPKQALAIGSAVFGLVLVVIGGAATVMGSSQR